MSSAAAAAAFQFLTRSLLRLHRPLCGVSNSVYGLHFPALQLHTTKSTMQFSQEDFEKAKDQLKHLKGDPGNEVKLKLYALFKQDSARQKYIELVSSLVSSESSQMQETPPGSKPGYETLEVSTKDNITKIVLNRPKVKNAVNQKMYSEIIEALEEAAKDDSVITVLTGNGDYYSSGNDLNNFVNLPAGGLEEIVENAAKQLKDFVNHFIDFPKPLIAVVNGPAVGIVVTVLGLFDIIYATNRATFHTPFISLGQSPEGCSSYTFPKIMGVSKATEMLLFNKKLTAAEACSQGLVTEVFPDHSFQKEVWTRLKAYASLPRNSLVISKQLIRGIEKEKLHEVNSQECECLKERWLSDECMNAITSFFQKKSKL
ncbi:enoyl-CoA delta isomerase 2 isoform X2 [Rhineura floridana]|uniref:enoyl-CoA delta isomerase 2 isoform X2 n=1 Tax=Rhineura floridana TaxID=261503 RepID=UPI002AC890D0|nr:enoyl-CoA delta isomerase 2 isoform X2 [Rhineura floridana]